MNANRIWIGLLVIASVLAVAFAVTRALRVSRADEFHQPVPEVDLICTSCGKEVTKCVKRMPMKCPSCSEKTLVLSAYCPQCDVTLPLLDSAAYIASSVLAERRFPEKVFPVCPKCGRRMRVKFQAKKAGADLP